MNDSFKNQLDAIKSEIPISARTKDPMALIYGVIFIAIGFFLLDYETGIGVFMMIVGLIGLGTGAATFIWQSPKVKLVQAVDSFLIALLLFLFAILNAGRNPWMSFAGAVFMLWVTLDNLKEYRNLRKLQQERNANKGSL